MTNKEGALREQRRWLIKIFILTFILSAIFNSTATEVIENLNLIWSMVLLIVVIAGGILTDLFATAVTSASEAPLHAKASDKKTGAKEAVKLVKNADRVSNLSADVIGDVCGVLSGAAGALVAVKISNLLGQNDYTLSTLLVTATITAITVLGKGIGKNIGIKNSEKVVMAVGKIISMVKFKN